MPCRLILSNPEGETGVKAVGDNVFLGDLPSDSEVYLFYYPGSMPNAEIEDGLKNLGEITGNNLFVNIGRLNDPDYAKIAATFEIKKFPVIVMTAHRGLASPPSEAVTAYVRIDDKRLMTSSADLMECVQTLFNLFIMNQIASAMEEYQSAKRDKLISDIKNIAARALSALGGYLAKLELSVSLLDGKFELKQSGD
ncbi:MAG: hypothetical protein ACT4NX_07130 [Deltaproteobacteria bacterium]